MSGANAKTETRIQGIGVSPGFARGTLYVIEDDRDDVARHRIQPAQMGFDGGEFPDGDTCRCGKLFQAEVLPQTEFRQAAAELAQGILLFVHSTSCVKRMAVGQQDGLILP